MKKARKKSRKTAAEALAQDGLLAEKIPGFAPRKPQQDMAAAIEQVLADGATLVCEAGTGTGKTFAYLVPGLLSGKRLLISTGTKTLQDQLFKRDLPLVREALGLPIEIALLKGRSNYLCLHRLKLAEQDSALFPDLKTLEHLVQVKSWAGRTHSGDVAELGGIPDDAPIWSQITSTSDNCMGQECPDFQDCYVLKARRKANSAEVLVINHHLFFADMALNEEGFGELLPGAEAVIFDEAHQLPDIAANFFGSHISSRQCLELCHDSVRAEQLEAGDCPAIGEQAKKLEDTVRALRTAFGDVPERGGWHYLHDKTDFHRALREVRDKLKILENSLEQIAERGKALESCYFRSRELQNRFISIVDQPPDGQIQWYELFKRSFILRLTPLSVAERFHSYQTSQRRAWVFTSATLSVGELFEHFCAQMGLTEVQTQRWESPFDFRHSSLLYVPQDLPEPRSPDYTRALVHCALPVLQASQGRAFFLFTSHRALREAADWLEDAGLPYPLLVQGSLSRGHLLERFRELGNAVLLGTGSFWEGVDVRGEALSCVIIDKLPFASPGDPVMEARINHLREAGGNPFRDYQLPQAVITLKQGSGRLIRDVTDRGVLMLGDPRLVEKPYGRTFLDSLPPMPKTRKLEVVQRFFSLHL